MNLCFFEIRCRKHAEIWQSMPRNLNFNSRVQTLSLEIEAWRFYVKFVVYFRSINLVEMLNFKMIRYFGCKYIIYIYNNVGLNTW